jgi:hypothetical protein
MAQKTRDEVQRQLTSRLRAVRGAVAGLVGGVAMTASTVAEMRLRGRPASDVPAQVLERIPGVRLQSSRTRVATSYAGTVVTGAIAGAAYGLLVRPRLPPRPAALVFFVGALAPDAVIAPAVGAAPPPWRWTATELVLSAAHHAVFAAATAAAYETAPPL